MLVHHEETAKMLGTCWRGIHPNWNSVEAEGAEQPQVTEHQAPPRVLPQTDAPGKRNPASKSEHTA